MPWHFGGDEVLTDAEIDAYMRHYKDKKQKEQSDAKKASQKRPNPRRKR